MARTVDITHTVVRVKRAGLLRMPRPNNVLRMLQEIRGADDFPWLTSHTSARPRRLSLDDAGILTRLIADHVGHSRVSMTQDTYLGRRRST